MRAAPGAEIQGPPPAPPERSAARQQASVQTTNVPSSGVLPTNPWACLRTLDCPTPDRSSWCEPPWWMRVSPSARLQLRSRSLSCGHGLMTPGASRCHRYASARFVAGLQLLHEGQATSRRAQWHNRVGRAVVTADRPAHEIKGLWGEGERVDGTRDRLDRGFGVRLNLQGRVRLRDPEARG